MRRCEGFAGARVGAVVMLMLALVAAGRGQTADAAGGEPLTTLHVYTNLVQIPVLVLNRGKEPMTHPLQRISISLAAGPKFAPTHVREEGEDPLSLAIVLDVTGPEDDLLKRMDEALAGLAPETLHTTDHVSIYAVDCVLTRLTLDRPAGAGEIRNGVRAVLDAARERRVTDRRCARTPHLWDGMYQVVQELYRQSGWRVMLAVTSGRDDGSKWKWNQVREQAQWSGVATFGLMLPRVEGFNTVVGVAQREVPFPEICQSSGGTILVTDPNRLNASLRRFVQMLRGRYIVEFPRPRNATEGTHQIDVEVDRSNVYVRAAGDSFRVATEKELQDRLVVPGQEELGPVEGKRKALGP